MLISTDSREPTEGTGAGCARCGFESPDGLSYCGCCGAPLDVVCPACGTRNPPRFRFCGGCGVALEPVSPHVAGRLPAEPDAERRQLTVMFCDLVGSTRLSLDLDPEELHQLVRGYQEVCGRAIERFDGHIAQYLGDGVLAYFGYPVALENEAERAVRAGLGVTAEVRRLGERWRHRTGEDLAVRVGIHTGLVVVGEVGSGARRENLALGGTPNIAARLQTVAEPNTVVISAVTHRLVSRSFDTTDLGPRSLRGVPGIGSVYRVNAVHDDQRAGRRTELIGRESELAALTDAWDGVLSGRGLAVTLTGDAGIGKSHLIDAFLTTLAGTSHIIVECRCLTYYRNTAFHPIINWLEAETGLKSGRTSEQALLSLETLLDRDGLPVREALPAFAGLLGIPFETSDGAPAPEALKERTRAWIIQMLMKSAESCPVVLLVEDIHWADPSTLELLDQFAAMIGDRRLLALFTTRPEFAPSWDGQTGTAAISLERLSPGDTERIVRAVAGKAVPAEVMRQIVLRTDGVPLFVEELSKTVLQSGLLVEHADRYELVGPLPPLAIPATLQDSLEARLDRLASVKEIAQVGAAIGREFPYDVLMAVAAIDEAVLRDALNRLVDAELIHEVESGGNATYAFKHALIQEAAYESLLRSTRQRYHMRIADVLVNRFAELAATEPETIALHYAAAGLPELSAPYWRDAGVRAMRSWANLEAVAHLRRGLEQLVLAKPSPDHTRLEFEMQAALGTALIATEGYTSVDVRNAYEQARSLCLELNEPARLAAVTVGLFAYHIVRLDLGEAGRLADELTELAATTGSEQISLIANAAQGSVHLNRGNLPVARRHFDDAIATYDPERHASLHLSFGHDLGVVSHAYLGAVHWFAGYPIQSRRSGEAAVELARRIGHPHSLALALAFLGAQHLWRRDNEAVTAVAEELLSLASEQRFKHWQADALLMQACLLSENGKPDAAVERIEHAASLFRDRGSGADPQYDLRMARVYSRIGRIDDALSILDRVVHHSGVMAAFRWQSEFCHLMAQVLASIDGRHAEAESWLRQSIADARRQSARSPELRAATSLGRILIATGRHSEAHDLLRPVYETFTEGHELPDLRDAAALLEQLAAANA